MGEYKDLRYDVDETFSISGREWRLTVETTAFYSVEGDTRSLEIMWVSYDPVDVYMIICSALIKPEQFDEYLVAAHKNLQKGLNPNLNTANILKIISKVENDN